MVLNKQMKTIKFKCSICGKLTSGRMPINPHNHKEKGDGSFRYPRRHKNENGGYCEGNYKEAIWVDVELTIDK
jgi:hypothetical protein